MKSSDPPKLDDGLSQVLDMMMREIDATYTSQEQRSAYRAGLSTAMAICDARAKIVVASNSYRGKVTNVGSFGEMIATSCGDAIEAARERVTIKRRPDDKNDAKMRAVRRCLEI